MRRAALALALLAGCELQREPVAIDCKAGFGGTLECRGAVMIPAGAVCSPVDQGLLNCPGVPLGAGRLQRR